MSKKNRIIVLCLMFIGVFCICLGSKSDGEQILEKTIENVVDKEKFGIYIENSNGEYEEYLENGSFPNKLIYYFNLNDSYCVDNQLNKIENVINYSNEEVIVTSTKTMYCYLYFDKDKSSPETFTFYLGENNLEYVTSTNTSVYLSWEDTDIVYYCLTNTQGSGNCSWQSTSGTSITLTHTLTDGDGEKTVYAYIKDASGNISPEVSDTIILDSVKPTITSVAKTSDEQTSITISVVASDDTSKIKTYYYKIGDNEYVSSTISTHTFTGLTKGSTYQVSVYVEDNAGLQSDVVTNSFATKNLLYFGQYLIDNSISGLQKTKIGTDTLYRFSGTSGNTGINNYICLGVTEKCADGSDNMYRIIGVDPSTGYVKVIKQLKYGNETWSSSTGAMWETSKLYSLVNTDWYQSISFKDMIVSHSWNTTAVASTEIDTREKASSVESGSSINANLGILTLADYYLAYNADQNWNWSWVADSSVNWIALVNNGNTSDGEWTMTNYDSSTAWAALNGGQMMNPTKIQNYLCYRPVFYLNSNVQYISGSGTSSDPFVVG